MLGWSAIADAVAEGVEIGAHTHSHVHLDLARQVDRARELAVPRTRLEQRLQRPVTSLAYPYGHATPGVRALAEHLGYDVETDLDEISSRLAQS